MEDAHCNCKESSAPLSARLIVISGLNLTTACTALLGRRAEKPQRLPLCSCQMQRHSTHQACSQVPSMVADTPAFTCTARRSGVPQLEQLAHPLYSCDTRPLLSAAPGSLPTRGPSYTTLTPSHSLAASLQLVGGRLAGRSAPPPGYSPVRPAGGPPARYASLGAPPRTPCSCICARSALRGGQERCRQALLRVSAGALPSAAWLASAARPAPRTTLVRLR